MLRRQTRSPRRVREFYRMQHALGLPVDVDLLSMTKLLQSHRLWQIRYAGRMNTSLCWSCSVRLVLHFASESLAHEIHVSAALRIHAYTLSSGDIINGRRKGDKSNKKVLSAQNIGLIPFSAPVNHAPPIGPHWDWMTPEGDFRIVPDGTVVPK